MYVESYHTTTVFVLLNRTLEPFFDLERHDSIGILYLWRLLFVIWGDNATLVTWEID